VTPVDTGVARPLIEGLSTETTVTDPSGMALFDFVPRSFGQALREAIAEEDEPGQPRRLDDTRASTARPLTDATERRQPGEGGTCLLLPARFTHCVLTRTPNRDGCA